MIIITISMVAVNSKQAGNQYAQGEIIPFTRSGLVLVNYFCC